MKQKFLKPKNYNLKTKLGFTIIEMVVGIAILAILISSIIASFNVLTQSVKLAREKTILAGLAGQYLEIAKNLPYSQIGTTNGNPSGSLPDCGANPQTCPNAISILIEGITYKVYYEVTYIDDPADGMAPADTVPADYKQVKMNVKNLTTGIVTSFLTNISPKGLEGIGNAGALALKVFDATGQPVTGANLHIENLGLIPNIILDRTSDAGGNWIEVGLPAAANSYHVVVTKAGYSSDQTYPSSPGNPNPTKADATIVNGQITQISFAIDLVANLTIKTSNQTCQAISGVGVNVAGAKLIGTNPNILKYNQSFSSSGGQISLNNIEWDTYTPTVTTGQNYTVYGTSPIGQITVLPASSQIYTIILGSPASANSLLVIVKDAATGTPLENALVHLQRGGGTPEDYSGTTGGSVWVQTDWSGGSGQVSWSGGSSSYWADDGNIDVSSTPTGLRLKQVNGQYVASAWAESSNFDTGAASDFTTITWQPQSQDPAATLKFQIASNTDNATWNYKGPDGTALTYYTVSGTSINPVHDGDRYVRYKAYLSTTDNTKTPVLTSLGINYMSGCLTPGQTVFPNLAGGSNYTLDINLSGYQTQSVNSLNISGNQTLEILMSP